MPFISASSFPILHGGVLNTPGGIPGNTRLALALDGTVRADGRQHVHNIFARAWDCLTRSREKVNANKTLARSLVEEIRRGYGDAVADMASRELSAQINRGRPLTTYRFVHVVHRADQLKGRIDDNANVTWLRGQGYSGHAIRAIKTEFNIRELRLLREADLSIEIGRQYQERQIPIHPRTLVTAYRDENVRSEPEELRGGKFSKPYAVDYQTPDGTVKKLVFKEAKANEGFGAAAKALGIDPNDSRMAVRNIATKAMDQLLRFNLVPETRIGTLHGRLGMVMGFAEGVPAMKSRAVDVTEEMRETVERWREGLSEEDFEALMVDRGLRLEDDRILRIEPMGVRQNYTDPGLRRELVKLQLLDAITAQGDRHGGNYLVRRDDHGRFIGLSAIDNDQAFGPRIIDPNQLLPGKGGTKAFKGVMLPPVVDPEIKATFENLTDDQLREALDGLLPEAEINAAVDRLHTIQDYLAGGPPPVVLAGAGPEFWGTEAVGLALSDPTTSYVGRDLDALAKVGTILSYEEAQ